MTKEQYDVGLVGLGVIGHNLLLNMADHGFAVAGYDKDPEKVKMLRTDTRQQHVQGAENATDFITLLRKPRIVIMLVPDGPIVDTVISDLLPHLEQGDLIIDAGNSHFTDTDRRQKELEAKCLHFFGMGISGGENGARLGPSLMPGGPQRAYGIVQSMLEACAAHVDGDPCVAYLGPHSVGHYVKMVHNGIEYGIMQLLAETYDLLRKGLGLNNDEMGELFESWNRTELNSYLVEITADIFRKVDKTTNKHLVDVILDVAQEKGTGQWASQDALSLHVPTPTIDMAVAMRNLSGLVNERAAISKKFAPSRQTYDCIRAAMIEHIRRALYAAIILTYDQGMAQLRSASQAYDYSLDLSTVARIWRGGCIIRSALLDYIHGAFSRQPNLTHLLLDETLDSAVAERATDLCIVVQTAAGLEIPVPALMASLAYFDSLRAGHLPTNLIQAQRDYFGVHTYKRVDMNGHFHTQWSQE